MTRQIEIQGPEPFPIAAASLTEWHQAKDTDRADTYDRRFGITAEHPVSEWEVHHAEQLTSDRFEEVWETARQHITALPS